MLTLFLQLLIKNHFELFPASQNTFILYQGRAFHPDFWDQHINTFISTILLKGQFPHILESRPWKNKCMSSSTLHFFFLVYSFVMLWHCYRFWFPLIFKKAKVFTKYKLQKFATFPSNVNNSTVNKYLVPSI